MNFGFAPIFYLLKCCLIAILVTLVTLVTLVHFRHFRHFTQKIAILKKHQFI